ncbi:MAG TPA: SAM-dependent methyltransferase [Candidatus Limivivens merdigallinarum]|uniref:SAM-dependent methyltransferase n=1 Tax=Candidatus Limivivens merdigallinarum TaxID=2840859 RepID=A0A9D1D0J7_9FIRM|nr:SAM-dependent methyltransferase [Candidatus Limivivens merdigallinarum]
MQLSKRMKAVADLAGMGDCLADVGTDHGYIPIYLLEERRFQRGIAMDVHEGPLLRARENIQSHGLSDRISCRLGDGLERLGKGEADTVVIAGMGGSLIIRILTEGEKVLKEVSRLVLQPQSEIAKVRDFLQEQGYQIEKEHMVLDEGKYYQAMRIGHGRMEKLLPEEAKYGSFLLKENDSCLKEYLNREEQKFREILESLQDGGNEKTKKRMEELNMELLLIERAKERMQ